MTSARGVKPTKVKVQEHRDRLRAQGLRPIQIWAPDVRASSFRSEAPLFRLPVEPNERNGLRPPSRLMVDKITTVPKSKVAERLGRLEHADVVRLNQAVMVFLGLAVSPRAYSDQMESSGRR